MINALWKKNISLRFRSLQKWVTFFYIISMTAFNHSDQTTAITRAMLFLYVGVTFMSFFVFRTVRVPRYFVPMLLFAFVMAVGMLYGNANGSLATQTLYAYCTMLVIVFGIIMYVQSVEDICFLFRGVMYGGLILDIFSLLSYGMKIFEMIANEEQIGRTAGNVNDVGLKSCYAALIALFFFLNEKEAKRGRRFLYLLIFALCMIFSLYTLSKKVFLLSIFGIAYMLLFRRQKNRGVKKLVVNFLLIAAFASASIYLFFYTDIFQGIVSRVTRTYNVLFHGEIGTSSDRMRSYFLREGFAYFLDHPIIGGGTAISYTVFSGFYSHNNYIELMMSHGLIGMIVFYWFYPRLIIRSIKKLRPNDRPVNQFDVGILAAFMILSMVVLSFAMVYFNNGFYQLLILLSSEFLLSKNDGRKYLTEKTNPFANSSLKEG